MDRRGAGGSLSSKDQDNAGIFPVDQPVESEHLGSKIQGMMNKRRTAPLAHLTTESRNPASETIDSMTAVQIVRLMNQEDRRVAQAVGEQLETIGQAVDVIAQALRKGGRLIYLGAGTSGRLGVLDASECPPTFNTPPQLVIGLIAGGKDALTRAVEGAEDHPEAGERDLRKIALGSGDVVVGIATSGRTPYVLGGLEYAEKIGAFTIGLSCNADSELEQLSRLMIVPIVGPEVLSGSTRLKAGTATKMVLNMLTTGAMIRMGKTYGNLMVDLRASNEKLTLRARRIVSELTELDEQAAQALLDRCHGELKTAIVSHLSNISAQEARERIAAAGGHLRRALALDQGE